MHNEGASTRSIDNLIDLLRMEDVLIQHESRICCMPNGEFPLRAKTMACFKYKECVPKFVMTIRPVPRGERNC